MFGNQRFHEGHKRNWRAFCYWSGEIVTKLRQVMNGAGGCDPRGLPNRTDPFPLARQYGQYGSRRNAALLRDAGLLVNRKRVERFWRCEGLKVPMKHPRKGRLWLNDGSCLWLRPRRRNPVWSYDIVHCRADEGNVVRTSHILDAHSRERLATKVKRNRNSGDVIDYLTATFFNLSAHPLGRIRAGRGGENHGLVSIQKNTTMDVGMNGTGQNLAFHITTQ